MLAALPLALLVLAAPAAAEDGRKHTTYRAAIAPVAAEEPTASPSRGGHVADDRTEVRGKAVRVDGRRRDRVKLRVRRLDRGTAYTWEIRRGGCAGEAACEDVSGDDEGLDDSGDDVGDDTLGDDPGDGSEDEGF